MEPETSPAQFGFPVFPDTHQALAEPPGLLASGGSLSPLWLQAAYSRGIFPWNDPGDTRLWWSPVPRAVITPDSFRIPRSIAKECRRTELRITSNLAFRRIIEGCATPRKSESGTWIDQEILNGYPRLNASGRALSVECWTPDGALAGGFYGLIIGQALFGESMYSRVSGASKIAFATAAPTLFRLGIRLIDCQMRTDHLARFGIRELMREEFETRLREAVQSPTIPPLPVTLR